MLEWRLDPASSARVPQATDHDVVVIVVCSEGYSSSLAAASLQDLGLRNATDLIGGFQAWRDAGLPVTDRRRLSRVAAISRNAAGGGRERAVAVHGDDACGSPRGRIGTTTAPSDAAFAATGCGEQRGARAGEHEREHGFALRGDHGDVRRDAVRRRTLRRAADASTCRAAW